MKSLWSHNTHGRYSSIMSLSTFLILHIMKEEKKPKLKNMYQHSIFIFWAAVMNSQSPDFQKAKIVSLLAKSHTTEIRNEILKND